MRGQTNHSSDYIIFVELINEYDPSVQKEVEKKIKRRLKYYSKGPYDRERVDYLRGLRRDLNNEIRRYKDSNYFKKTPSKYAEVEDFNIRQMLADFHKVYDKVSVSDLQNMIGWAVHWLHTR